MQFNPKSKLNRDHWKRGIYIMVFLAMWPYRRCNAWGVWLQSDCTQALHYDLWIMQCYKYQTKWSSLWNRAICNNDHLNGEILINGKNIGWLSISPMEIECKKTKICEVLMNETNCVTHSHSQSHSLIPTIHGWLWLSAVRVRINMVEMCVHLARS